MSRSATWLKSTVNGQTEAMAKGVSGCPGGLRSNGKRYQHLYSGLKAELGGDLTAIEDALLDKAVMLLLRKPRSDADAVKLTSELGASLKNCVLHMRRRRWSLTSMTTWPPRQPRRPTMNIVECMDDPILFRALVQGLELGRVATGSRAPMRCRYPRAIWSDFIS